MMRAWQCELRVTQHEAKLLQSSPEQGDLLKARLDPRPSHPRALLTMLEGLSLWSGHPLCVALHVDERSLHGPCSMLFGDELWPADALLKQVTEVYDLTPETSIIMQCLKGRAPIVNRALIYRTRMGKVANTLHTVFPLFKNGELKGAICLVRDTTLPGGGVISKRMTSGGGSGRK